MAKKSSRSQDPEGTDPDVVVEDEDQEDDPFGDLAFFSGAEDDVEWGVERYKTADEVRQNPRGRNRVFVTKVEGKVDLVAFQREFGGGVFRFWGKRGNGEFYGAKKVELAGPRRSYNEIEAPAQPTHPSSSRNGLTRGERLMLKAIQAQNQILAQLIARPAEKSSGVGEMVDALAKMDQIRGRDRAPSDASVAKEMFVAMTTALNQGIAIGAEREPSAPGEAPTGTDWGKVLENGIAVLERMSRRAPPPRRPPPPPAPGETATASTSNAQVFEPPVIDAAAARWIAALDRLETMVRSGVLADEAAEEIAVILTDQDLAEVLPFPNEAVIAQIVQRVSSESILATPDGRAYLALVLDELRKPDSGD